MTVIVVDGFLPERDLVETKVRAFKLLAFGAGSMKQTTGHCGYSRMRMIVTIGRWLLRMAY